MTAVTEKELATLVRDILRVREAGVDRAVAKAYVKMMNIKQERRENLEKRNQRYRLLRRVYEAGFRAGQDNVRKTFGQVVGTEPADNALEALQQ
jgi:hypothetical protein